MRNDLSEVNGGTQPLQKMKVFNNWDVVAKGWYAVTKSSDVLPGKAVTRRICGQQLAIFRTKAGKLVALDAYCPHMGLNLALGNVEGDGIRCKFHAWRFDSQGKCTDIPCKENAPRKAQVNSYAVEEQYGYIWVYPDETAPEPVFVPHTLRGKKLMYRQMTPLSRSCHPHVPMLNGVDIQHIKAVHGLDMTSKVQWIEHSPTCIEFYLSNEIKTETFFGRAFAKFFGTHYGYSNVYANSTLALLNTVKKMKFLNRFEIPELFLLLSLRYTTAGRSEIFPIAVTESRKGIWGKILSFALIQITNFGFLILASDEGDTFFEGLRYRSDGLLPYHDKSISQLIAFTNRQEISKWSRISPEGATAKNSPAV